MTESAAPTKPVYEKDGISIFHGDNREILPLLAEASFVSCVTDPPYSLGFMNKKWDSEIPDAVFWSHVLRVLKPGGHLLSFGGTRTWHRLACAIEDGGFEIRDTVMWVFGNGWPKSLDISKGLAKRGSPNAGRWAGWATGLKPAWEPVIVAMKPLDGNHLDNAEAHGAAGLAVDACRVPVRSPGANGEPKGQTDGRGRWPANLLLTHSPGCVPKGDREIRNPSGSLTGAEPSNRTAHVYGRANRKGFEKHGGPDGVEIVEDWECVDDCPVAELDRQTGISESRQGRRGRAAAPGDLGFRMRRGGAEHDDRGGASRFFYHPKADNHDRGTRKYGAMPLFGVPESEFRNTHPTVKPLDLVKYLCALADTPDHGPIVDPFMGSGTTLLAARAAGRRAVGIEREKEYVDIAVRRLEERP